MKRYVKVIGLTLALVVAGPAAAFCQVVGNTVFCNQSQRVSAVRVSDIGNMYRDAAEANVLNAQAELLKQQTEALRQQAAQTRTAEKAKVDRLCAQEGWSCN